jgi:mono/diheme cytochrome c family protein
MSTRGARMAVLAGAVLLAAAGAAVFRLPGRGADPVPPGDAGGLYAEHCAVCHGPGGKGDGPGARVIGQRLRDFTDPAAMGQVSDRFLFQIIQKGGSQFGRSNGMPAWGMKLTEAEIAQLVELIRSFATSPGR